MLAQAGAHDLGNLLEEQVAHRVPEKVVDALEVVDVEQAQAQAGIGPLPADLRAAWDATLDAVLAEATLKRPAATGFISQGKLGQHSEHLGYVLAEMQSLARKHPGATW
jgi:ring-1,2-phenylacetyl-CoA epoxidase subunit PaaC